MKEGCSATVQQTHAPKARSALTLTLIQTRKESLALPFLLTLTLHLTLCVDVPSRAEAACPVHGIACWFDVLFDGSVQPRWLTTAPGQPTTHWRGFPHLSAFLSSCARVTGYAGVVLWTFCRAAIRSRPSCPLLEPNTAARYCVNGGQGCCRVGNTRSQ